MRVIPCLLFVLLAKDVRGEARGPVFVLEPPHKLDFSNSSGGWLDCSAAGQPAPMITWLAADGSPAMEVPGVRRILLNGTLVLLPFPAAAFRQDVHSTTYRCLAENSAGRVVSRTVQVRAVVSQAYQALAEAVPAVRGCTAILRCVLPSFVKEFVRIVSWLQEPSFYIYPSLQGDGKFHMLPTGELLIHGVDSNDQYPSYRCRTMHRLTRQVVTSSSTLIRIIPENRMPVPPLIVEHSATVHVVQDEGAVLVCAAQGCPAPDIRWYRIPTSGRQPLSIPSGEVGGRARAIGPLLALEGAGPEDAGMYRCSANNSAGAAGAELRLVVSTPLRVNLSPGVQTVELGATAEFHCDAGPEEAVAGITWLKDGRLVAGGTGRRLLVRPVRREDKGMYQCVARSDEGVTAQAAAELTLGDAPPSLLYSFIEQTMQPGPSVSLKCSAAGNPTPSIEWRLDGFALPPTDIANRIHIGQYVTVHGDVISHINISHVAVEDGGEYSCSAKNRAGGASHAARLNVYGLPYVRPMPKVTAVAGETLYIKCPVAGYPIEDIRWERTDGRELPVDLRQKVFPNGTLAIRHVQKPTDAGMYTCTARNKQGHSSRRNGEITVIVPPSIEPFSFQEGLSEGMRTRTICGVSSGDPPISVTWLKDGAPIANDNLVNVSTLDSFSSLLNIKQLVAQHSGDYTCVASNLAAVVRFTATLSVKVPPKWVVEPVDTNAPRGRHVMIQCQADGVPTPTVTWKKARGSKSGDYEELRGGSSTWGAQYKLLSNGSLLLQHVKEDHEGFYLCQASNGIGEGIGKVIQLHVNSAPYFAVQSKLVSVRKGETAELKCDVSGDAPINVVWLKGKEIVAASSNYRYNTKQEMIPSGVSFTLQIMSAEGSDAGSYYCQATNVYGRDQQLVQLAVQEPPASPNAVEMIMVSSRSSSVQWKPGSAGDVTQYFVQYLQEGIPWDQARVNTVSGGAHSIVLEPLQPATRYIVRVTAQGPAGRSAPSPDLRFTTQAQKPAGPPLQVSVTALSSTTVVISWSPPRQELQHGTISGYNVGVKLASGASNGFNFTSVPVDTEEGRGTLLVSNLRKFSRYLVVVQAINQEGAGPLSEPVAATTLEDVPSKPPQDVRCVALSPQSIQVSWQPPPSANIHGLLQGYKLIYELAELASTHASSAPESRQTTALTIVLQGLARHSNYTVQVAAITGIGDGPLCRPIYCKTAEDVPGAPRDIKVIASGPQTLLVSWLPPSTPRGSITGYTLHTRLLLPGSQQAPSDMQPSPRALPPGANSFELNGLRTGVEYQFWVSASTRVGDGPGSRIVSSVPSGRVPAKIASFGQQIIQPWRTSVTLPCIAVGLPTFSREWSKGNSLLSRDEASRAYITDSGALRIDSITRDDEGNYSCHVHNSEGADRILYKITVQVPPAAPSLYISGSTSSSVVLHWKAGDTGGAPLTGFSLHFRPTNGDWEELSLPRYINTYELKDLRCGSEYQIFLTAHGLVGSSPASSQVTVRTQGSVPGRPPLSANSQIVQSNSTSVLVRLHNWPDGGCPLSKFELFYKQAGSDHWNTVLGNMQHLQRRHLIFGLSPATMYDLKVVAFNVAGQSANEFSFTTLTLEGEMASPELIQKNMGQKPFYTEMKIVLPLLAAFLAVISAAVAFCLCWKNKGDPQGGKECQDERDNKHNSEHQREQYYATIHKAALQAADKIPESAEDISPYATFHLAETVPRHAQPSPGSLLHSFIYHEQATTEGCASPPSHSVMNVYGKRRRSGSIAGNSARLTIKGKKGFDSEEYNSPSDSDPDQVISSRTESSNQLDGRQRPTHNFMYHGAASSTSSDLSPTSDQKSLPRRGKGNRNRWIGVPTPGVRPAQRAPTPSSGLRPHNVAETPFYQSLRPPPYPSELSEAECDIDTLKKLKLRASSSLWSRPSGANGAPEDFSIAV
ncbi:cell adhesion molecule Dscam2 isoform X1 [Neocloeon triangulifer]|uniref:cell adhesion molecule Dscam2 isoform X1 n=1 Tax=Neocloeon triangulifer TaxID=2078957 RepID=UPI00286EC50D|nr:cell adhesion molecule Dscam2 isoform X1 [Neocloeon triangulifer]